MKKIVIASIVAFSTVLFISCAETNASSKINKANLDSAKKRDIEIKKGAPAISFDKSVYNFGTVNEGDIVEAKFTLTNTGKTALVISNAESTCGCTVPVWPKEAIKPGESSEIVAKFNTAGKPNRQSKTITLTTNTASGREVLTLKGSVTPKAKK
ncbi:MAG: DUF1573 domain-containing protein [Flavobacteriaceae bacterium]